MTQSDVERLPSFPFETDAALAPPAEWAEFQAKCPVARVTLASGDEASLITRYDDVKSLLSDPRFTRPTAADNAARVADTESGGIFNSEMSTVIPGHGEEHLKCRRMIAKGKPGDLKAGLASHCRSGSSATCSAFPTPTGTASPTGPTSCSA